MSLCHHLRIHSHGQGKSEIFGSMILLQLRLSEKHVSHTHSRNVIHRGHRQKIEFHSEGDFHLKRCITITFSKARE